jgi:hypothetical protein
MKKSVLVFSMMSMLTIGGLSMATAQDQPKPKKDTVNMDTYSKPEVYYPVEDEKANAKGNEKGGLSIIAIIGGVVVIGAVVTFFALKKKK